jgi:diguanylate cyclase (GGDEF)-like protein
VPGFLLGTCNNGRVRRGIHGRWLSCLALLALWLAAACANAQDVLSGAVLHSAPAPAPIRLTGLNVQVTLHGRSRYWIDTTGAKTVEEVEAAGDSLPWSPRERDHQHRIDGAALWIQFEAVTGAEHRWFLELSSSGVDRAQLFYRQDNGRWVVQEAGDTKPVSQWPVPGRVPTFELSHHDAGEPIRYYLRVEHARVDFAAAVTIYDQARLVAEREREQFLLGGYFGLAAMIALVSYRDRAFAAYALYVALLGLGQVAYLGVGAQHLWDRWLRWNEVATFVLPGVSSAAGLWFVRTVTEPARYSRLLDLLVLVLITALIAMVGVDTIATSRVTFGIVMALTALALGVIAVLIGFVWSRGDDPAIRLIALGFLPVLVMACFPVARGLNLIPNSPLTRYGLSIGAVLEMPILFYALSLRGSRRRESQMRAAALAHTDALTGLADPRSLVHRLETSLARARAQRHACGLLGIRISNFEAIVSEFGREAAEKALVVAASVMRQAIHDTDLAARMGDHEFALLLEGPTSMAEAISHAQQVVAGGLRQVESLPQGLAIKFHVAMAMLPEKDLDAQRALRWVLTAAQDMPSDARKLIRSLNF